MHCTGTLPNRPEPSRARSGELERDRRHTIVHRNDMLRHSDRSNTISCWPDTSAMLIFRHRLRQVWITEIGKHVGRQQCAALPWIERDGQTWILLITSRETRRWVLPKGWAESGMALHEVAALEAYEEAGLIGTVGSAPVATFRYRKRLPKGRDVTCEVIVFPFSVARQLVDWPERGQRETRWFTPVEAAAQVREADLAALLLRFDELAESAEPTLPRESAVGLPT